MNSKNPIPIATAILTVAATIVPKGVDQGTNIAMKKSTNRGATGSVNS